MITEAEHMLLRHPRDRADAPRVAAAKAAAAGGLKAANGHANGGAANGHAANGHAANGHAANGHAANGHAANGHAANGHAANGAAVRAPADACAGNLDPAMLCSGADAEAVAGFNVQLAHGSESPVDALPATGAGFHDTFGSVWEWCAAAGGLGVVGRRRSGSGAPAAWGPCQAPRLAAAARVPCRLSSCPSPPLPNQPQPQGRGPLCRVPRLQGPPLLRRLQRALLRRPAPHGVP
jgi:hypothetical protein